MKGEDLPLKPEHGPCDICGTVGCYVLRHDRLENDAQALSLARKTIHDPGSNGRAVMLAGWIVRELMKRKRGGL